MRLIILSFIFGIFLHLNADLDAAQRKGKCIHMTTSAAQQMSYHEISTRNGPITYREFSGTLRDVVVFIPGGPGIDGRYLDAAASSLARASQFRTMVLDLPNHGVSRFREPPNYDVALHALIEALQTIAGDSGKINLVGHSLGAYLAADLASRLPQIVDRLVLLSTPVQFGSSSRAEQEIARLGVNAGEIVTESDFENYWEAILPAYFSDQASLRSSLALLKRPTFFLRNQDFLTNATPFPEAYSQLSKWQAHDRLLLVEGGRDLVQPEDWVRRFGDLSGLQPHNPPPLKVLAESGHFMMLEKPIETTQLLVEFLTTERGERED